MKELKYVGKEKVRLLGPQIVTGKAKYTGDFKLPGMQYGKILRSPHPYAKIEAIDVEKAKAYPGVTAVVTWKDVDPNIYITNGFTPPKHHHIMDQYVRFIGDAVALVVAETEDIALEAMKLMNEIQSDFDCEIEAVLVSNEQKVEYGQPLFRVKKL